MVQIDFRGLDDAIVIDAETTGLSPSNDRLVSVAALHVRFSKETPIGEMYEIVNPQRPIPVEATALHGISDSSVVNKEPFANIAQELRDFIGDLPIIAHNATFDMSFLEEEFRRAGVDSIGNNKILCTMRRFRDVIGARAGSKLQDAVAYYRIPSGRFHSAYDDAMMAFQLARVFHGIDN